MFIDINAAGCSNTCRHCSADGCQPAGGWYSLAELRALKQAWGPLTIRFEPTAHPDFPAIYAADIASEHGGWLVTNGFGLAQRADYREVLAQMGALGIHTAAFTLHGLSAHHDWFVCRPGAFDDLLLATRRAKAAGLTTTWQVFVDRRGLGDVPPLVDLAFKETGALPLLCLPYHRVGGRLRHYEALRPTLDEVVEHRLHTLFADPKKNYLAQPEALTAQVWLEQWRAAPDKDDFKHPYEPRSWPPTASYEMLSLRISRDRKVYFDPMCHAPIYLGQLTDGRAALVERLEALPLPAAAGLSPFDVTLAPGEQRQLHPSGFSLRYKEIAKRRQAADVRMVIG
jgi:hypothetical protein